MECMLTKKQWFFTISYGLIFPLSQVIGGGFLLLGIIITFPFLAIGYITGMAFISIFGGGDSVYILGVTLSIIIQLIALILATNKLRASRE